MLNSHQTPISFMKKLALFIAMTSFGVAQAQQKAPSHVPVRATFNSTHVINNHSVETLKKRYLDFRIAHRFGDVSGGWETLIGFETAADVSFAFDYGVTDNLTLSLSRTKGTQDLKALVHGSAKYRILRQTEDNAMPLSLTALGQVSMSTMKKSSDPSIVAINSFPKFGNRLIYTVQLMAARKFGKALSLQASLAYMHRNIVNYNDENDLIVPGLQSRIRINDTYAVILDAAFPINKSRTIGKDGWQMPLGVGFEWVTGGGHVFQMNLTNTEGLSEVDFLPATQKNWAKGQFRLGFCISRLFYFRPKVKDEDF